MIRPWELPVFTPQLLNKILSSQFVVMHFSYDQHKDTITVLGCTNLSIRDRQDKLEGSLNHFEQLYFQ